MNKKVAFILGAGFSKASNLPTQTEFSSLLISEEDGGNKIEKTITKAINKFLMDVFGWSQGNELPELEDIFTCIDLSAGTGHTLAYEYEPKKLRAIRRMAIYRIFKILNRRINIKNEIIAYFGSYLNDYDNSFIILNWDIVLERYLSLINSNIKVDYGFPCLEWETGWETTAENHRIEVPVFKIHGSANWVYCESCKTIFQSQYEKLPFYTRSGLDISDFRLFKPKFTKKQFDNDLDVDEEKRICKLCRHILSSHIATFSYRKSFRTFAYPSIWHNAEKYLSESPQWIFIGYSLPDADFEFKHMIKVAELRNPKLSRDRKILVIVKDDSGIVRKRYEKFFGPEKIMFVNNKFEIYARDFFNTNY